MFTLEGVKDCYWSLYNVVDDTRVDGLRTAQLKSLMRTIARSSLDEWLVWEEDTPDWKRASEVVELLIGPPPSETTATKTAKVDAPDPTEKIPPKNVLLHETDQDEIPQGPVPADERKNPRFLVAFKVFINVEGRVLTNTTVNVSVGGMKLRHPLPNDLLGSFDVTLINGPVELGMRCRALKNHNEKDVTRLLIEHCNRLDLLRTWLTSAVQ